MDTTAREIIDTWRTLVMVHDRLMKVFEGELKREHALTIAQYDVLLRIAVAPDQLVRMSELARTLLYSSGAATKVVDRLVDRGLVNRATDDADRRLVWVTLTDAGAELIERAQRDHGRSISREIGPFASAEEKHHVRAYLARLTGQTS